MTWQEKIKTALMIPDVEVSRYFAAKQTDRYIVWAEDGRDTLRGDGIQLGTKITGTIDFFTKTPDDPVVDLIERGLDTVGLAWAFNSQQYEENTDFIHYEWRWEVF